MPPEITIEPRLKEALASLKNAIEASMDPICAVDTSNYVVFLNLPMRSLLRLSPRKLREKKLRFCDIIQLSVCKPDCRVKGALETGRIIRFDETPAARGQEKFRLTLKITPIKQSKSGPTLGAFISVRDVTGEFLVQAKYHKSVQLLEERDLEIVELKDKIDTLRRNIRRS